MAISARMTAVLQKVDAAHAAGLADLGAKAIADRARAVALRPQQKRESTDRQKKAHPCREPPRS